MEATLQHRPQENLSFSFQTSRTFRYLLNITVDISGFQPMFMFGNQTTRCERRIHWPGDRSGVSIWFLSQCHGDVLAGSAVDWSNCFVSSGIFISVQKRCSRVQFFGGGVDEWAVCGIGD
jgi:hypothetical protein